jgi:hypothetical protein
MIEFGSRWISGVGCKCRVIEVSDRDVRIRWEGSFDDVLNYNRADFLDTFREFPEEGPDLRSLRFGSRWWSERAEGTVRGMVVGSLDGLVAVQVNDGGMSFDPVTDFEGYGDDFVWSLGAPPMEKDPRAEMEAKMAAIQADLDELKRLLVGR